VTLSIVSRGVAQTLSGFLLVQFASPQRCFEGIDRHVATLIHIADQSVLKRQQGRNNTDGVAAQCLLPRDVLTTS
jgi:hypothetical protein